MKSCRFNYFLNKDEKILHTSECNLKGNLNYQIINEHGILLASNDRLLFCNVIGDHPHLIISFDYKYLKSIDIKGDDTKYMYFKYDGQSIKITDVELDDLELIMKIYRKFNSTFGYNISI